MVSCDDASADKRMLGADEENTETKKETKWEWLSNRIQNTPQTLVISFF